MKPLKSFIVWRAANRFGVLFDVLHFFAFVKRISERANNISWGSN